MRKIKIDLPTHRKWQRWVNDCQKETKIIFVTFSQGGKLVFNEALYRRRSIKAEFFFSKEALFYGKCAYCETYITDSQHGDVEHFRPKGAVTDEDDNPIILKDGNGDPILDGNGEPTPHPGYYWLAYDWCNLLPSCIVCNQPKLIGDKKIGKHNRFPVDGNHAQTPTEVDKEQPLLINPASDKEDDNPEKHLTFDLATGLMIPLTERGEMCIKIFGLNLRDQLIANRKLACRGVRDLLVQLLYNSRGSEQNHEAHAELQAIRAGKRSYSMAANITLKEQLSKLAPLFN